MKAKRFAVIICVFLVIALLCACAQAGSPKTETRQGYGKITLVGATLGSTSTTTATVMSKILNTYYPEIQWSSRSGEIAVNALQLNDGLIKIAVTNESGYIQAFGAGKAKESRLRTLSQPLTLMNFLWFIPADKPWQDLSQIPKGLNLCGGQPGGAGPPLAAAWLNLVGLDKKDFNYVELSKTAWADAWRAGKIDIGFNTVAAPESYLLDIMTTPRKPKPLGLSDGQAKKALEEGAFKRVGFSIIEKSDLIQYIPDLFKFEVTCPRAPTYVVCRDDFPEDIAYKISKILDEHHGELVNIFPSLTGTPATDIKYAVAPFELHGGVAKYYKEKGYLK